MVPEKMNCSSSHTHGQNTSIYITSQQKQHNNYLHKQTAA
jgi:hypothetical protein